MGTWNPQWDATEPLVDGPRNLNRRVGVTVGRPFHHHGLNATYVDIERETPTVNTTTWGNCYPVEEARNLAREYFESTISDLDRLIWHLAGHRDRLKAELDSLPEREFQLDVPVKNASEVPPAMTVSPAVVDVRLPETA